MNESLLAEMKRAENTPRLVFTEMSSQELSKTLHLEGGWLPPATPAVLRLCISCMQHLLPRFRADLGGMYLSLARVNFAVLGDVHSETLYQIWLSKPRRCRSPAQQWHAASVRCLASFKCKSNSLGMRCRVVSNTCTSPLRNLSCVLQLSIQQCKDEHQAVSAKRCSRLTICRCSTPTRMELRQLSTVNSQSAAPLAEQPGSVSAEHTHGSLRGCIGADNLASLLHVGKAAHQSRFDDTCSVHALGMRSGSCSLKVKLKNVHLRARQGRASFNTTF